MRLLFTVIIIITAFGAHSQTSADTVALKQRLIAELMPRDDYESWCLGFACNSISELHRKADSLLAVSTMDDALAYFRDTSYSLKIYSYRYLLERNDTLAFRLLQESIHDSTWVDYHIACVYSSMRFNHFLVNEYRNIIKMKYYYGGRGTWGGNHVVHFPPRNRKMWKKKERDLNELLATGY